jgi:hypothetical protein
VGFFWFAIKILIPELQARPGSLSNMLFRLMCLYQNGVALGTEELLTLPRYTGYLALEEWIHRNRFSSFSWRARLLDIKTKGWPRDIVPPLYNPHVVKMPDLQDLQMTLNRYERQLEGRSVIAHMQYWVLLPLPSNKDATDQSPIVV